MDARDPAAASFLLVYWAADSEEEEPFLLVAPGISDHDAEAEVHSRGFDGGMNSLLGRKKGV